MRAASPTPCRDAMRRPVPRRAMRLEPHPSWEGNRMTSATRPIVSVVMPCYNRARSIGAAIDSVRGQTFQDWELVVVNDGSTENLDEAMQAYRDDVRIRLVSHVHNRGEPAARNTGIAAARGRFVAFLDSDDLWLPEKLARQVAAVM